MRMLFKRSYVHRTLLVLVALSIFAGYAFLVSAAAPSGGYTPGATLDPDCAPGDTDCIVQSSGGGGIAIGDAIGNSPDVNAVLFSDASGNISADSAIMSLASDGTFNQTRGDYSFVNEVDSFIVPGGPTFDFTGVRALGTDSGNDLVAYIGMYANDLVGGGDVIPTPGMYVFNSNGNSSTLGFREGNPYQSSRDAVYVNETALELSPTTITARLLPPSDVAYASFDITNWDGDSLFSVTTEGYAYLGSGGYDASSLLTLNSTTKGFLAPRMTEAERDAIASPATGLFVYNTDTNAFNYYDGSAWGAIGGGGGSLVGFTDGSETWLGVGAGDGIVPAAGLNTFIGRDAGYQATNATYSTFLGSSAGSMATNAQNSNFMGYGAGAQASNVIESLFLGNYAGNTSTDASYSVFLGGTAGFSAPNASYSVFAGYQAGREALNASNSIFIGYGAGYNDTVDNTGGGSSILIGRDSSTGGFSNSIAIGTSAISTAINQFLVGSSYTNWQIAGIDYVMPNAQGDSGSFLSNDGSGALSWVNLPTGTLVGSTNSLETETWLGVGAGSGANSQNTTFIGYNAGGSASGASDSVFIGQEAGSGATNATGSYFFGNYAGLNASEAFDSIFIGSTAGGASQYGSNSIFIGKNANADVAGQSLNNSLSSDHWSLVIGNNASTGGFSNSIAVGYQVSNTATNQFVLGSATTPTISDINEIILGVNSTNAYPILYGNLDGVSIGSSAVDASAILDLTSVTKGFLAPRMTQAERDAISSPANGLMVYNTDSFEYNYYDSNAAQWTGFNGIPSQSGNAGNFLTTDGTNVSWIGLPTGTLVGSTNSIATETWLGVGAGGGGASDLGTVFIGNGTGLGAIDALSAVFIGYAAGENATNALASVFIGETAGVNASGASRSIFIGQESGRNAVDAGNSVFLGTAAGYSASQATNSNFFGNQVGNGADGASYSNFIGDSSGFAAVNATYSNFIGTNAGDNAVDAAYSTFIGYQAGMAANSTHSLFLGNYAGKSTTAASYSNFIGNSAGQGAFDASYSNFIGDQTGGGASDASYSNFIGSIAGVNADFASYSNFIGAGAGLGATNAAYSIFIGKDSGNLDTVDNTSGNDSSILIGNQTSTGGFSNSIALGSFGINTASNQFLVGSVANSQASITELLLGANDTNAYPLLYANLDGVSIGSSAVDPSSILDLVSTTKGFLAPRMTEAQRDAISSPATGLLMYNTDTNAFNYYDSSVWSSFGSALIGSTSSLGGETWLGSNAGDNGASIASTTFIGDRAGDSATGADESVFVGITAGQLATNARDSIFLGPSAGYGAANAAYSIFIGLNAGSSDTVDNTLSGTSILLGNTTSTGGFSDSIALGTAATNTAANQFMIGSATSPIDEIRVVQTGGTECIIDGTGLGCTSDERLKTNISDLGNDTLSKLLNVRTVSYNWNHSPSGQTNIGFLAQDLEQYFPELVSTNERGQKSVYYAQMTPVLVEAIRELDVKLSDIENIANEGNSFGDILRGWLASATNGIAKIVSGRVETNEVCVDGQCLNGNDVRMLLQMVQQQQAQGGDMIDDGNTGNEEGSDGSDTPDSTPVDESPVPDPEVISESQEEMVPDPVTADVPVTEPEPVDSVEPSADPVPASE
jgi:hypothetical protein